MAARRRFFGRPGLVLFAVLAAVVCAVGVCEVAGWPFLAGPLQRKLASSLDRHIDLGGAAQRPRIHLLGAVRLDAKKVVVGAPAWSRTAHTFDAEDVSLRLRYRDLWHAYRTGQLRIDSLSAHRFDAQFERLKDGRASWQFKPHEPAANGSVTDLPVFGRLNVDDGSVSLRDAKTPLEFTARYTLNDGSAVARGGAPAATANEGTGQATREVHGLWLKGKGRFKQQAVAVEAQTEGVLILEGAGGSRRAQPIRIDALAGDAKLTFTGSVQDPLHLEGLLGSFEVGGPSLSAAGEPLGVTLPTTPKFDLLGRLAKHGDVWNTVIDSASIGSSRLHGAFVFDSGGKVPLLSGRLRGSRLALADLGPAIGEVSGASSPAAHSSARKGRIVPDRPLDFPSLKVMNANVLFDLQELELASSSLAPFKPARAHLVLHDGVLALQDLDLRTADGSLSGSVMLDSRKDPAAWHAKARVTGVHLDRFIHAQRKPGDPPYVAGRLDARLDAGGTGRSVAGVLASLQGELTARLKDATLSHLALKAAGLDVAGGIKVLMEGDEALPVRCNVAHLVADKGIVRPKPLVLSLDNATLWADGQLSFVDEALDLRVISAPKDFTPVSLRTPVEVKGTLSAPTVSIQPSKVIARAGAAALLALLNPLAAIVPFLDPGSREAAHQADEQCLALAKRLPMRAPAP